MAVDNDTIARLGGRLAGTVLGALHFNDQFVVDPMFDFDGNLDDANPRMYVAVNGVRFKVSIDFDEDENDACTCGEPRRDHVYGKGPCRPGWACKAGCKEFVLERQALRPR